MCTKTLNVRPQMNASETIEGYLLRTLRANTVFDLHEAKRLLVNSKASLDRLGSLRKPDIWSFINDLHILLGRTPTKANQYIETTQIRFPSDSSWAIQHAQIDDPRLCLECLKQGLNYLPWYWQTPLLSCCPEHECLLTSCCPDCQTPLKWHMSIHRQCHSCQFEWALGHQYCVLAPRTDLERSIAAEITENKPIEDPFISDLMSAILRVARPFDYELKSIPRIPHAPMLSQIINQAYRLISSLRIRVRQRQRELEVLDDVMLFDYQFVPDNFDDMLRSRRAQIAFGSFREHDENPVCSFNETESDLFLPKGIRDFNGRNVLDARYLISSQTIARLFQINEQEVSLLTTNANFKSYQPRAKNRPLYWDIRKVMAKVRPLLAEKAGDRDRFIRVQDPALERYLDCYSSFLGHVLQGRYKGTLTVVDGLSGVYVDRNHLASINWQHFLSVCAGHSIRVEHAADCLGISPKKIHELVESGKLIYKGRAPRQRVCATKLKKLRLQQITQETSARARSKTKFVNF